MSHKKSLFVLTSILLLLINILLYVSIYNSYSDDILLFVGINLFSIVTYLILYIQVIQVGGLVSIHSILHIFYFLFLYGKLILYFFSPDDSLFWTEFLITEHIGINNICIALIASNTCIICIDIIYFLYPIEEQIIKPLKSKYFDPDFEENFARKLLMVLASLFAIKLFLEFKKILEIGYVAMYAGGLKDMNYYSFVIQYSHVLFMGVFAYYLTLVPNRQKLNFVAIIFILVSFLDSLKGARIFLILPLFYMSWYYFKAYRLKLNYKYLSRGIIFSACVILFSIIMKSNRNNEDVDLKINPIVEVVNETGATIQMIGRYIVHKDELEPPYPFFLEPLLYPYFYFKYFSVLTAGQSNEMLLYRNSLNHQLTAKLNFSAYIYGIGLGSSTIAEFYQYGYFFLIPFSLIYGFFLVFIYKNMKNKYILYLSPIIVMQIFFMARESPYPNLIIVFKALFSYFIFKIVMISLNSFKKSTQQVFR